jgi:hypothetical protein
MGEGNKNVRKGMTLVMLSFGAFGDAEIPFVLTMGEGQLRS